VFHDEGKEGESARSWLGKGMSNYLERGGGGGGGKLFLKKWI